MGIIADLLKTAMRDFQRYTGDGLPGEPVARPLPVGDPASGQFNPTKKQVRDAFLVIAEAADDLNEAVEAADYAAELSAQKANASAVQAGVSTTQAGVSTTAASEATLAAIAAGANLVTSLTDPVPPNGSVELLQTGAGTQVHEVQDDEWKQIDWLGVPIFPTIAAMAEASGFIHGQSIYVEVGENGEMERFSARLTNDQSALDPNGTTIVSATGMGVGRLVSRRTEYNSWDELDADRRTFPDGINLRAGTRRFTTSSSGAITLTGGIKVNPTGTITPFHWGAAEEAEGTFGGTDQSAKIQGFLDYINDNFVLAVNWTGSFSIASAVTLGATSQVKTMYVQGRLFLRAMNDLPGSVFRVDNLRPDSTYGDLIVQCFGGADYSVRNTPCAIELGQVSRDKFGTLQGVNAQIWGIYGATDPGVNNLNLMKADKLSGLICGSGYSAAGRSHTGTVGSVTQYGTASSTSQATRISLSLFSDNAPAALANYGIEGDVDPVTSGYASNDGNPVFIRFGSTPSTHRYHQVIHHDRAGAVVWVYPQIDHSITAGEPFTWIFGGGVGFRGSDSNVPEIGILEASNCGIGFSFAGLYGPKIGMMLIDAVGVGVQIGGNDGNSCFGTRISSLYLEGVDAHLLTTSRDADFEIGTTFAFDKSLIRSTVEPSDAAGLTPGAQATLQKGRVGTPEGPLFTHKLSGNTVSSTTEFVLGGPFKSPILKTDTVTFNLSIGAGENLATGVDSDRITIIGTNSGNAPTSVTFSPPSGSKINGGTEDADEAFTTFSGPGYFTIFYDIGNDNWIVVQQ